MDFDYTTMGDVKLSMIPYAKKIEDDFPELITCTSPIPAADHLSQVRPDDECKLLPEEQASAGISPKYGQVPIPQHENSP